MPVYEYRCASCGKVSSFFTKSVSSPLEPSCNYCHSAKMQRRMSSFAVGKTTRSVHQQQPAGASLPDYYRDPRNIGRHVEASFQRHGVEMPQSVRDTIQAAREGTLPKELDI